MIDLAVRRCRTAAVITLLAAGCAPQQTSTTTYQKPAGSDQYVKAVTILKTGDQERAITELEKAVVLNPSLRMAQMTLGELYIARQEYEKAVPHLQVVSDIDPYTLRNHYNLGLSLQMLNQLENAASAYIRGLKLEPDDFKSNMNLGLVYFALNRLDPAAFYLEKATRLQPNNARAWSNSGVVHDARGNFVFAEASYRKSLELDPANEPTLINLTANLINQKRPVDAVTVAQRLVSMNPSPLSKKRLGDALTAAQQWDRAVAAYDSAMATDARFTPALNAKAEMFIAHYEADLRLDDDLRKRALTIWQESLKLAPEQPGVKANIEKHTESKVFR